MITTPTTRQPWLHALLVLTLSVLVSYSFTTARAQEKEVPAKVREGSTTQKPSSPSTGSTESDKKPAMKDGEREGGKPSAERDGGTKKPGVRDGEGGVKKPGSGDGEGTKKPGARDGEGGTKKPGPRDGEKARTGEADQETTPAKKVFRSSQNNKIAAIVDGYVITKREVDEVVAKSSGSISEKEALESLIQQQIGKKQRTQGGEGGSNPGARDGEGGSKTRKGEGDSASVKSSEVITMHVTANGDTVLINGEKQPISGLRGHLSTFLREHPGAKVIVSGDPDTPLKSLHEIVDAVRDNGNKNVGIKAE